MYILHRIVVQWLIGISLCLVLLAGCDLFGSDDDALSLESDQDTYAVSVNQDQVQGTLSYTLVNGAQQAATFSSCNGAWTDAYRQGYILIKCPDQEVMPRSTYQGSLDLQVAVDNWVRDTIEGTYRLAWRVRMSGDSKEVYSNPFTLAVE